MDVFSDYDSGILSDLFSNVSGNWCYTYDSCMFEYRPCEKESVHPDIRYTDSSASWVLIASILVFFMKAGFMLLEVAFARDPKEKRHVVVLKHQDAFASAFGFFLLGYDLISNYTTPQEIPQQFFGITDPVLWFFKFTFASNAATIVGGCLVTNKYKLRMPAAFVSAFVISGIIHPVVARIIWSDQCTSLSPYRFCEYSESAFHNKTGCGYNCTTEFDLGSRLYILDFAGGGAVHLIGGMAGLVICLFAKFQYWRDERKRDLQGEQPTLMGVDLPEEPEPEGFWEWMYPVHGGDEAISEAALGVFILWFCWFAFNCGSTESIEIGRTLKYGDGWSNVYPYYGIPSVIAVNMIMAGASGGIAAIAIAVWAQIRYRTESVNANEIANGVLSALVSITAGCAFVDYWGACLIGFFGVLFYHLGCFLEYKTGVKDTARVVPVHGVCGLWSLIATALFLVGDAAECNLHAAFEGLCYCELRLPPLNYGERLLAQILAGLIMIAVGGVGAFLTYLGLYIVPIKPFMFVFERIFFLNPRSLGGLKPPPLRFVGGWLLTSPEEELNRHRGEPQPMTDSDSENHSSTGGTQTHTENSSKTRNRDQTRSNLGTTRSYVTVESNPSLTPVPSHTYSGHSNSSGEARVAIKMNSAHEGRESAIIEESENSDPDQL